MGKTDKMIRPHMTRIDQVFMVVLTVFLGMATLLFLVSLGWLVVDIKTNHEAPHCPTEDSCRPVYDGEEDVWTIEEVTP